MKKILLSLILLTGCVVASAQVNLREGIVITLQGDTLHGMIDYRTDRINSEQCVFLANGASATTTYRPGQIEGYRFLDNGRFYVSRLVPLADNTQEMRFVEYLVRGQMNGYALGDGNIVYLESEDGQLISIGQLPSNATTDDRRQALADAYNMLNGSGKAQKMLWNNQINARNATRLVVAYNDEVCPDGQCEVFKFRAKKTPKAERPIHWAVDAGYTAYRIKMLDNVDGRATFPAFNVNGGIDIYVPRLCKGLQAQIRLDYTSTSGGDINCVKHSTYVAEKISGTELIPVIVPYTKDFTMHYKANEFTLKAGPAYQFPFWKVQPRVGYGTSFTKLQEETSGFDYSESIFFFFGVWAKAGVVVPLSKGAMTFDGSYAVYNYSYWQVSKFSFNVGYQF